MADLRKGETYADLAAGFAIGTTTVFRYIREALDVLAALTPTLRDMGAAREHGILDALHDAGIRVIADNAYRGSGFAVPQRRRRRDPAKRTSTALAQPA
jgi:hypothetical protein